MSATSLLEARPPRLAEETKEQLLEAGVLLADSLLEDAYRLEQGASFEQTNLDVVLPPELAEHYDPALIDRFVDVVPEVASRLATQAQPELSTPAERLAALAIIQVAEGFAVSDGFNKQRPLELIQAELAELAGDLSAEPAPLQRWFKAA